MNLGNTVIVENGTHGRSVIKQGELVGFSASVKKNATLPRSGLAMEDLYATG